MALTAIAFYLMAAVTVFAGFGVVSARNPVHSVLWLILAFFSAAGLFVLMGAEFLAMLLVVVYVGAVAVLFLVIVLMLDVDFAALRSGFTRNLPFGILLALVLLIVAGLIGWRVQVVPVTDPAQRLVPSMIAASCSTVPSCVKTAPRPALKLGSSSRSRTAASTASSALPPLASTREPVASA